MCGVLDISQAWEVDAANQIPLELQRFDERMQKGWLAAHIPTGNPAFHPISQAKIPRPVNHTFT